MAAHEEKDQRVVFLRRSLDGCRVWRVGRGRFALAGHLAFAAAMVQGATKGLELLDALKADARIADHHRLDAVRAHLLELAGDRRSALRHYQAAAGKTGSLPERNYLLTQAARLSSEPRLINEQE